MKTYVGNRFEQGCEVYVHENGRQYPLPWHLEIRNHSPTGFEWGYLGSGPAQLALAILADYFGPLPPPPVCPYCESPMDGWKCLCNDCGFDGEAGADNWKHIQSGPTHYQNFKSQVIAGLNKESWELTGLKIDTWASVAKQIKQEAP